MPNVTQRKRWLRGFLGLVAVAVIVVGGVRVVNNHNQNLRSTHASEPTIIQNGGLVPAANPATKDCTLLYQNPIPQSPPSTLQASAAVNCVGSEVSPQLQVELSLNGVVKGTSICALANGGYCAVTARCQAGDWGITADLQVIVEGDYGSNAESVGSWTIVPAQCDQDKDAEPAAAAEFAHSERRI